MKRLDLSQITNHPLVQNRTSPEADVPGELRSRTNSQVVQQRAQAIDSNIERQKKMMDRPKQQQQQPLKVMKELQAASLNHQVPVILSPKRAVSEFLPRVLNLETIQQSPVKGQAAPTNDSNNNNNNNEDQKNNNQSNFLRIRRSTSLSYTSTLRKRRNDTNGAGLYNSELPSPRPNVKLSNFSISPYNSSSATLPRRLSIKEKD